MKPVDWKAEYNKAVEQHNQTIDELQHALHLVDIYEKILVELWMAIKDAGYTWTPAMQRAYELRVKE